MEWLQSKLDEVITLPHEAILLRWTAAIKEKAEKLLGNADKGIAGYIDKGVVGAEDSYVVAINGRLLRGQSCFASINLGPASAELREIPAGQLRFAPDSPQEEGGFELVVPL
jgi:hypothetical protein